MPTPRRSVLIAASVLVVIGAIILARSRNGTAPSASSPPRGRIAFVGPCEAPCHTPAELFTVEADGSGKTPLIQGAQPAWSADGSRLAFVDPLGRGIRLVDANGSGLMRLTSCRSPNCVVHMSPTWAPDDRRVAFVTQPPSREPTRSTLAVVTVIDGTVETLLSCPQDGCRSIFHPAWSPDGGRIAFWDMQYDGEGLVSTLRVLQLSTGKMHTLYECPRCGEVSGPTWFSDGQAMVIDAGRNLFVIDATSGQLHRITACHAGEGCGYPSWSPDGAWIAFSRLTREGDPLALFLIRPNGADLHPLGVKGYLPSWRSAP